MDPIKEYNVLMTKMYTLCQDNGWVFPFITTHANNDLQKSKEYTSMERNTSFYIDKVLSDKITRTSPGSVKYLVFGEEPSRQSISIKLGKVGELIVKNIISETNHLELLNCGVQVIDEETKKQKDLDLLWIDKSKKIIYYREAKGNIELDTEKLQATIEKILEVLEKYIKPKYQDYEINIGIFAWSVYNRSKLKKGLSHIKKCESNNIRVDHMEDLLKILDYDWPEQSYNDFFRNEGKRINALFTHGY